jgi:hypothetical protein
LVRQDPLNLASPSPHPPPRPRHNCLSRTVGSSATGTESSVDPRYLPFCIVRRI